MQNKFFVQSKLLYGVLTAAFSLLLPTVHAQLRARSEINLPDIPGYFTLKCDLHMHTVFSDGLVWPTVRVAEAWRQGYDAIAITDHIEYLPHKADVSTNNLNRSYEIAKPAADSLGLLLIKGIEITRGEPPGHWNALFIKDVKPLQTKEYKDAVKAAIDQGAFLFWNHPGWKQPKGKTVWYKEQGEVYDLGWLHGLEIVNGLDYDPIVHKWCLDKNLTLLGNSDVHSPIGMDYEESGNNKRPMTLVFAVTRSIDSIKEALTARRTAVMVNNAIYGNAEYLAPLFYESIQVKKSKVTINAKGKASLQIHNSSCIDFELAPNGKVDDLKLPAKCILYAGKTVLLELQGTSEKAKGERTLELPFTVKNLISSPDKGIAIKIGATVVLVPAKS